MGFALGPAAAAAGYRMVSFDTIDSTSTEALARAKAGDPGRIWVVSNAQTAGLGRRGRAWETPHGNLAASLLLKLPQPAASAATLGFVAGLATAEAIRACAPALTSAESSGAKRRLALKWPNDLLLDGAKLSGILLQASSTPGSPAGVVVGIGVNIAGAPPGLPYPAASLSAAGFSVTAEQLFAALSDAWVPLERTWAEAGFAAIRSAWLKQAAGLGEAITVRNDDETANGTFDTIDDDGMLVIKQSNGGSRRIAAGDVHFGAAATMRQ